MNRVLPDVEGYRARFPRVGGDEPVALKCRVITLSFPRVGGDEPVHGPGFGFVKLFSPRGRG